MALDSPSEAIGLRDGPLPKRELRRAAKSGVEISASNSLSYIDNERRISDSVTERVCDQRSLIVLDTVG